jgi:hypothetical protein
MYLDFADLAAAGNSSRKACIILDEDLCVLLHKALYTNPETAHMLASTPIDIVIEKHGFNEFSSKRPRSPGGSPDLTEKRIPR